MPSVPAGRTGDPIGSHLLLLLLFLLQHLKLLHDLSDTKSSPVLKEDINEYLCLSTEIQYLSLYLGLFMCKGFLL